MTTDTGLLGTCWQALYPEEPSKLPSIGTFCAELSVKDSDPESGGLSLWCELPDEVGARSEHTLDVMALPRVVIVHAAEDVVTGMVIGAALRRKAAVYIVGEGAEALVDKLHREGASGLLYRADAWEAAQHAIEFYKP